MKTSSTNNILVLETDLFPDTQSVDYALKSIASSNIRTLKIVPDVMDKTAWADVLRQIMRADKLLVL